MHAPCSQVRALPAVHDLRMPVRSRAAHGPNANARNLRPNELTALPPSPAPVSCVEANVRDGYGSKLPRKGSCYDPSNTVTVAITDTCPCNYPSNAYSNKRECEAAPQGLQGRTL